MENYRKALSWITKILKKKKIKFNVLGGLAAYSYGSKRSLWDIDLIIKNQDFKKILPDVKNQIVERPHFSKSRNWQCYFMELKYLGKTIEIGGSQNCKILNSRTKKWQKVNLLSKSTRKKVLDLNLPIIPKQQLISYKSKLNRQVDRLDIQNIK